MLKKILGICPQPTPDEAFSPSKLSLKLATSDTTDYAPTDFGRLPPGKKRAILVICTESSQLPMANGKLFSTGNHPVETLVPMLHLKNAGFGFDICTPTGKPAKIEMWAMPVKDKPVMAPYNEYRARFETPLSMAALAKQNFRNGRQYKAIFIPGGHGALLGLPEDKNLGKLIRWAFEQGLFTLAICHGPAALLAARPEKTGEVFPYSGYKMAAFPDKLDRQTPLIGYMPGQLTWFFGEKLKALKVTIVNSAADKTCVADRRLITGASPQAANEFGKLAAVTLLQNLTGS